MVKIQSIPKSVTQYKNFWQRTLLGPSTNFYTTR